MCEIFKIDFKTGVLKGFWPSHEQYTYETKTRDEHFIDNQMDRIL